MDFGDISGIFGGSILFDDYHLDIQDAESQIDRFERYVSTEEERFTLYLLRGLLSASKGEFNSSEAFFQGASRTARFIGEARLISRCETYEFMLFTIKADLPMLRFHDDTAGDWRMLSDAEAGSYDRLIGFIQARATVWSSLSDLSRLERDVVSKSAQYMTKLRTGAFPRHPAYHQRELADVLESSIPFEPEMAYEAERLGLKATSRHLRRLNAGFRLAGASEQGIWELEQLYQECMHDGDLVGAASCQLALGDNRLSLPFTSPVVLNLSLMNRISSVLTQWHESMEAGHPLVYDIDADRFYQRAFELFADGGSIRGTAAVHLRRGCVALAQYMNALFLGGGVTTATPHAGSLRMSAEAHIATALDLYQGDGGMVKLVSVHKIILDILNSCPPGMLPQVTVRHDAVTKAAHIGNWASENANLTIARVAGLLFLGVGRLISTAHRNIYAASLCCSCARSCFLEAGERILELHATIEHAKLHQSHGDMEIARSHLDACQNVLRDVIQSQIDPLLSTVTKSEDHCILKAIRTRNINNLDSAATTIYANNPRADVWAEVLRTLIPQDNGSTVGSTLIRDFVDMVMSMNRTSVSGTVPVGGHGTIADANVAPEQNWLATINAFGNFAENSMNTISRIREKFYGAMVSRRKALVEDSDWDRGQSYLEAVLQSLDRPDMVKSTELYSIRAMVLYHLGRRDVIRQWLPDAIPTIFGGRLSTASDKFTAVFPSASPDLQAMSQQVISDHGERSLSLCYIAQDWSLGGEVLRKVQECAPQFLDRLHSDRGESVWFSMVYIASIEEHVGNFRSSFNWFVKALRIIETSRSRLKDVADRRELLNVIHSAELFAGLARLSLRFHASQGPEEFGPPTDKWALRSTTWADEALLFLEQGRARVLLDLVAEESMPKSFLEWTYKLREEELNVRSTSAEGPDGNVTDFTEEELRSLRRTAIDAPDHAIILDRLHRPHFASDARSLYASIPDNAIVIHINPSQDGVIILYMSHNGIELARPNCFSDLQMEKHVIQYLRLFKLDSTHTLPSKAECQTLLTELSDEILLPARSLIERKSHLIFVPSQSLNKFPFSVLLLDGEPLFMKKEVSVVPSLSVLQHLVQSARNKSQDRTSMHATVIYKAPPRRRQAASQTHETPLDASPALNFSASAAIEIAARLGCRPLPAQDVSPEAFKERYDISDIIIIGTHGTSSVTSVWDFNIELQSPLRVLDLVRLRSQAALVVFEACVSGVGEASLGNDVLGFAHSVLASGVGAFLGAMWSVSDMASAMLMSFFFCEIADVRAGEGAGTIDEASNGVATLSTCLRRAQIKLYNADAHTVRRVMENFKAACENLEPSHINPVHLRKILLTLNMALNDEVENKETDYSHPFYWAPFVLVGYGGQRLGHLVALGNQKE